jgi:hypothetical protein
MTLIKESGEREIETSENKEGYRGSMRIVADENG